MKQAFFSPRATASSPLSSRIDAALPLCDTSARAVTEFVAKTRLSEKLWRAPSGLRRRRRRPRSNDPAFDLLLGVPLVAPAASPPNHSPQNTENPLVGPDPSLTATEAVEIQLRALESDDTPWSGHGVQTAYLFCIDAGSLEMSRYFDGRSASLYHEDHFVGKFRTTFPELLRPGARVAGVLDGGDESGREPVRVEVETAAAATGTGSSSSGESSPPSATLVFSLERCEMGRRKGSWLVSAVHRKGEEE